MQSIHDLPRDASGSLISFAWPGGYPVAYLDAASCVICPDCANAETDPEDLTYPDAFFIHWEGPDENCEQCGKAIPSAYGDPDDEE